MKKLKYTLSVLLILTGFIFTAELYQNYLTNICSGKYYFSIEEKDDRDMLAETLQNAAKEHGLGIFAVTDMVSAALINEIDVYADETARRALAEKDITEGEFASIFSGKTIVNFHDFQEIAGDTSIQTFYFTGGGMDEVLAVKNQVLSTFATSYVHRQEGDGREWMIYAIWGLIYALLLLLAWMTIQYEKKEVFIRVSLGASMKQITARNIAADTLFYLTVWTALRLILGHFLSLNYRSEILGGLLALFLLAQILLHVLGCRYDYREIMYGAQISPQMLGNCYALKMVSMFAAILATAICVELFAYNYRYFAMYKEIEAYEDYSFLSYTVDTSEMSEDENLEIYIAEAEAPLFYSMDEGDRVAFAVLDGTPMDGITCYMVNENTVGITELLQAAGMADEDFCGITIFLPNEMDEEVADELINSLKKPAWSGMYEGFAHEFPYRIVRYDEFELLYFDSELEFGFEKAENPVMMYFKFDYGDLNMEEAAVYLEGIQNEVMYRLDGWVAEEIAQAYGLKNVRVLSVTDRCNQYRARIVRMLILNLTICIFMLALEVIIITTIIRLEYTIYAKEMALKKILGYSTLRKNRFLLGVNLVTAVMAGVLVSIYSLMYASADIPLLLLAAVALTILEFLLIVWYVVKTERSRVPKILKGGAL